MYGSPNISYSPSPEEIHQRKTALRLMEEWPDWVIESIMLDDSPTVPTLIRLIERYGSDKTLEIIEEFSQYK